MSLQAPATDRHRPGPGGLLVAWRRAEGDAPEATGFDLALSLMSIMAQA